MRKKKKNTSKKHLTEKLYKRAKTLKKHKTTDYY